MSRREKRKFKKLMLGLGGCIMASSVAAMVMAYSPRLAGWTLPAQDIADASGFSPPKPGWTGRIPPPILPFSDGSQGAHGRDSGAHPGNVASVPTKADTDFSGSAPQEPPQDSTAGGPGSDPVFTVAPSAGGGIGGTGSSWPGTINPNPAGFRSSSRPSVSGGGSVGPSNPADQCATQDAKDNPECQTGEKPHAELLPPIDKHDSNGCTEGSTCAPTCPTGLIWTGTGCAVQTVADTGPPPNQDVPPHQSGPGCVGTNCSTGDTDPIPVPEPASLALMLAGLAGIGLTVRRR